jgi:membrane dipeptidase
MLIVALLFNGPFIFAQKAAKLHHKAMLADTHNDILGDVVDKQVNFSADLSATNHTDMARLKAGGMKVQVFSIFCDERYGKGTAFAKANRHMDSLMGIIKRHPDELRLVTTPNQIKQVNKKGMIACMMGVEGGHMIEDRLDYLDSLYRRGARYMTLTWNNSTSWATSAKDETENTIPDIYLKKGFAMADRGLDSVGVSVVKRMEALGMMIDISHVGEATFKDVLKMAKKPVIASHSSVYALCPHRRNLKDYQLKAIRDNNGVVFVNFYSGFLDSAYDRRKNDFLQNHRAERDSLREAGKVAYEIDGILSKKYPEESGKLRPPLSVLMDHIDYIVKLIGINHVGLGSDFDGIESAPQGLEGVQDFPKITLALLDRGYSNRDIKKILGGNFMRVLKATSKG